MVAKTALVALLAVCVFQGLHALRRSSDGDDPWLTPEEFLNEVFAANETVYEFDQMSHDNLTDAVIAQREAELIAKVEQDVQEWPSTYQENVQRNADYFNQQNISVSSCTDTYDKDIAEIVQYVTVAAKQCVLDGIQGISGIPDKADALLPQIAAVIVRAQAEAVSPDYGANIDAILDDAWDLQSQAAQLVYGVDDLFRDLRRCTSTMMDHTWGSVDIETTSNYAVFCMRIVSSNAAPAS